MSRVFSLPTCFSLLGYDWLALHQVRSRSRMGDDDTVVLIRSRSCMANRLDVKVLVLPRRFDDDFQ